MAARSGATAISRRGARYPETAPRYGVACSVAVCLALAACQMIPDESAVSGTRARPPRADVIDLADGFLDDGSFFVGADGASPGFVISAPFTTCALTAPVQWAKPGAAHVIPFSSMLTVCGERDAAIRWPEVATLSASERAENYRRVAECVATRLSLGMTYGVGSVDGDPCPATLGVGWRFPTKAELVALTDTQRQRLTDGWRSAKDGIFSSLVVLARDDDDTLFAVDVSPNGHFKSLHSKFSHGTQLGGFTPRCVRGPEPYPPPPALSSEARTCMDREKTGPVTRIERETKEAAEAQAARPLYPDVIAFRDMVDRLRTVPELDLDTIRNELTRLQPTLQRIRTYTENHAAFGERLFGAYHELQQLLAEGSAGGQSTQATPARNIDKRISQKKQELEELVIAQYDDDGELRNLHAIRDGFQGLQGTLRAEERLLADAIRALRAEGTPVPETWRMRVSELQKLRWEVDDAERNLLPPPKDGEARMPPRLPDPPL